MTEPDNKPAVDYERVPDEELSPLMRALLGAAAEADDEPDDVEPSGDRIKHHSGMPPPDPDDEDDDQW